MSSSLKYNSAEVFSESEEEPNNEQSSQLNYSESESGSEGSSLESVVTQGFYPQFPTPCNF